MDIQIYLARNMLVPDDNGYVLVPECFLPSSECDHLHGPLFACGRMTITDDSSGERWQQVMADIDQRGFALIDTDQAERLFGVRILRSRTASLSMQSVGGVTRIPERVNPRYRV